MAKLYITNLTKQRHEFCYRLPEEIQLRKQMINEGGQILVSGRGPAGLNEEDIKAIIEQHTPFGIIDISKIDQSKPYIGLAYSIDREISINKIGAGLQHNDDVKVEEGFELRKQAAVAVNQEVQKASAGSLKNLEMSVSQDVKEGERGIAEGIRITREGEAGGSTPATRGGRGGRGGGKRSGAAA